MTLPSAESLYEAVNATWPAASTQSHKGWLIQDGQGGGKRVSAAIQLTSSAKIRDAESAMVELGQSKLFMIRQGEDKLDEHLNDLGYELIDQVVLMVAPIEELERRVDGEYLQLPNSCAKNIWQAGGIGPARLSVMARSSCPKTYVTIADKGIAYVAIHNGIAMAHAVEVSIDHRRQGLGKTIMHHIAGWAHNQGAKYLSVITVKNNIAARTLYQNMGMTEVGEYHYRIKR